MPSGAAPASGDFFSEVISSNLVSAPAVLGLALAFSAGRRKGEISIFQAPNVSPTMKMRARPEFHLS